MVQAAIFGFGNIGSGVAAVLEENREQIAQAVPGGIHVKYILDIRDFEGSPYADRVVHDIDIILNDPEIKVVCETMGGKEPAFTFSKKALERGISVCSSNKELVEAFGPALLKTAADNNCSYLFEASVGGGIPLLTPLLKCLSQEKIQSVTGILNGTTNYILSKMEHDGAAYEDVLREAQEFGYAERDPRADVEGYDTGRKIAILSSLMTGKTVRFADTCTEGITKITPEDFSFAKANGYSIKLLGVCSRDENTEDGIHVITAPFMVPEGHPLYSVRDVFNGVLVHGNMVDDLMFYGRGAGKYPTGSAVAADMILAVKNAGKHVPVRWDAEIIKPVPSEEETRCFYLRSDAAAHSKILSVFGDNILKEWRGPESCGESVCSAKECAFVTKPVREGDFFALAEKAGGIRSIIRILQ